jgi:hypothetical protein
LWISAPGIWRWLSAAERRYWVGDRPGVASGWEGVLPSGSLVFPGSTGLKATPMSFAQG